MRRIPKQARSQQRVNHILTTASQLFAEMGYEHVTTNAIAAHANIPIGSLYQFFPSKEAILKALVEGHTAEIKVMLDNTMLDELPITEALANFLDKLAIYHESHIDFEALLAAAGSTHATMHNQIVEFIEEILVRRVPELARDRCHQISIVMFTIVKGITQVSSPPDNLTIEQAGLELKTALIAYLQAALRREGIAIS